jgi:hypothetical protein
VYADKELDLLRHGQGEKPAVRPPRDGEGYDQACPRDLGPEQDLLLGVLEEIEYLSSLADRIDDLLDVILGHAE